MLQIAYYARLAKSRDRETNLGQQANGINYRCK